MDRSAFGTSAAVDRAGRLWVAYAQPAGAAGQVVLQRSDDGGATLAIAGACQRSRRAGGRGRREPAEARIRHGAARSTSPGLRRPRRSSRATSASRARSTAARPGRRRPSCITTGSSSRIASSRCSSIRKGRLWVAWVDKRDLKVAEEAGRAYRGAAIYYAHSDDRGATWSGDTKLADSSCECCRIALAVNPQGRVAAMWRHVFEPNERDHAFALLGAQTPAGRARDARSLARRCVSASRPVARVRTGRHATRGLVQSGRRPGARVLRTTDEAGPERRANAAGGRDACRRRSRG